MRAFAFDTSEGPTLVLSGSAHDHLQLRDALLALSRQPRPQTIKLRASGLLTQSSDLEVIVQVAAQTDGASLLPSGEILWLIKEVRLVDFADLLTVLAEADGPGHQYLDGDRDQLIVKASRDEYDADGRGC